MTRVIHLINSIVFIFLLGFLMNTAGAEEVAVSAATAKEEEMKECRAVCPAGTETGGRAVCPAGTEFGSRARLLCLDTVMDEMLQRQERMMRRVREEFFSPFAFPSFPAVDYSEMSKVGFILPERSFSGFTMSSTLLEREDAWEFTLEVPGLSADDLKITFERNRLTVSGEKQEAETTETDDRRISGRRYGSFQRSFTLPAGSDPETIQATCRDGLLTVVIPKPEKPAAETKTIPIGS